MADLLLLFVCYLFGSISGSLMLGRFRGVDIRQQGSGNAGGTNAFRTQGFKFALGVVLIDVGKGALAAYVALRFSSPTFADALPCVAVVAAVIGHVWPVFHGFRGGKGAATLVGGVLLLWPMAVLVMVVVWLMCLTLTGFVGLSTVVAGFSLLILALINPAPLEVQVFAGVVAFLMLFTHRANMQRLWQKNEYCFDKAMIWRRVWRALRGNRV